MLTGKQRAALRAMANTLQPVFQIGKGNINENFVEQIDGVLETRELIKISILETADVTAREASDMLCEALGAEPVQCIGRKLVLYRASRENPRIEI
ncbi:MAG: ribosome assembly RNA-binding protein YhbY [Clostridia bacterium]|nr:ribosome assembly RNA-binding protein YhbY [Clostridia bacterium]MBQ4610165.1 ribosome assembly RNA-binding protein YhbY [Clostridia bacterium]MBQ6703979.1 ribosome assembly RNA-binding protein YhbY [Clostridia bacterium]MBQ7092506.1 ribosome assembly RNA-binding protein YhbY [Clostridia bacterium]MBR5292271.1 ribosome assembly RNA-binding protein YhbY [Clostridia bacterium]